MYNNIVIIGAGTAGTIIANKLRRALSKNWTIYIIDNDENHYYQPGFLFIPFDIKKATSFVKPKKIFIPEGVNWIKEKVKKVDASSNKVILDDNTEIIYDILVIASGTRPVPEETLGLKDKLWNESIFEFYTYEGSIQLAKKIESWNGGKLVMAIVDMPIKCPVAPIEFVCLSDAYFTKKGIRKNVEITYVTPLSGVFTKPVASKYLGSLMSEKNINIITDFYINFIDNDSKTLVAYDERKVPFDLLVVVPINKGDEFVRNSNLGDDLNFIPVDKYTLQHPDHKNIFVIGDAAAIPTSKAGSVAHFAAEVVFKNILYVIKNKLPKAKFDGHANCFIETGYGKAVLVDFNYDIQPLPGKFPLPIIGPMSLLKNTRLNHWGKIIFEWVYWNILLKARFLPISNKMNISGKKLKENKL